MKQEHGYLELLGKILEEGEERHGRNGITKGLFGERLEFDLKKGFPLLTTKKMFWRGIVEELLWFLKGSTDANELKAKGVHIWDGNTTREFLDAKGLCDYAEGECGPIYGYQWRCFGGDYPKLENGMDQIKYLLQELTTNPHGRRAILSGWNPKQLHQMCLPPCHVLYNFYMSSKGLSCQMYQRSCDTCAGLPFNIASTSLLTTILAKLLHVEPHRVIIVIGDTHIYEEHYDGAKEQVTREPMAFPTMSIAKDAPPVDASVEQKLAWLEELALHDFVLQDYQSHPTIKFPMVA
jgi:thymidylate synthase